MPYTNLHRAVAFAVGDEHARRIMWLIRAYCRLFRVGTGQRENLEWLR
jgi:hypothetical protein